MYLKKCTVKLLLQSALFKIFLVIFFNCISHKKIDIILYIFHNGEPHLLLFIYLLFDYLKFVCVVKTLCYGNIFLIRQYYVLKLIDVLFFLKIGKSINVQTIRSAFRRMCFYYAYILCCAKILNCQCIFGT